MAARYMLQRRALTPVAASAFAASVLLYPKNTLHAESPPSELHHARKPIYSNLPPKDKTILPSQAATPSTLDPPQIQEKTTLRPTPTDLLATYIRRARLFTYAHTAATETYLNDLLSTMLHHERSFTSTLASLKPPPQANEEIMPGALYVLVATMAGSIISRNRNILLRATVPAAVGVGVAWAVLPGTMRNVSDLAWKYEKEWPLVANNHLRIRGAMEEGLRYGGERTQDLREWGSRAIVEAREGMEGWVRKGR